MFFGDTCFLPVMSPYILKMHGLERELEIALVA